MRFGGIQKNSLIDYPSKVSCVLFVQGCNFRCPYCHNPQLVDPCPNSSTAISEEEALAFLDRRKNWLDGVVISGGEPTLQKDLFDFCGRLKKMGFSVKLDTNGSRPEVVRELIDTQRLDYIAMDVKTDFDHYEPFIGGHIDPTGIRKTVSAILASGLDHEFRTTCVRPIINADTIRAIGAAIKGAKKYVLQQAQCVSGHVLSPEFLNAGDWCFDAEALSDFRDFAAGFVESCIIRWAPYN